jgi:S1-C subfamily serine protease
MNVQDKRQWIVIGVLVVALACLAGVVIFGGGAWFLSQKGDGSTSTNEDQDGTTVSDSDLILVPFESVVQITAWYLEEDTYYLGWTGSGTIISADGLILTNAHVVLPDKYFPVDALTIALTVEDDKPPVDMYTVEVLQADEALDIAVLQITADYDFNPIDKNDLDLPFVPLGDADSLILGEAITILGYPGIGGATITLTAGEVSGFTQDPVYGDRAFIKTNATIAGGNSGGLAVDSEGRLIGVPTQLGYGGDDQFVDCRVLADTNKDGYVNDQDSCVPTGGFINALRPINLALPLIQAAENGEVNVVGIASSGGAAEIPQDADVLFEDYFEPPSSGWYEWDGDATSVEFINGDMQISIFEADYYAWNNPELWFTDVILSAYVHVDEPVGDASYGLICRYQDEDNFYSLEVSEDGYFAIFKKIAGDYEVVEDWHETDLVPSSGTFEIYASCIGDELTLAVDGTVLGSVEDNSFSDGDVGVIAETWNLGGFTVSFEDFIVLSAD